MRWILIFLVLFSNLVFAQGGRSSRNLASASMGDNRANFKLIPYVGSFGFSGSFEHLTSENLGWGASLTFLPEEDDPEKVSAGLVAFGGNMYLHVPVDKVDIYFSPGLQIMMMELGEQDETRIGSSFAVGTMLRLGENIEMGLEHAIHQPWFSKDFFAASRIYYSNTAIAVRVRF